jgi:hypothetical protein
MEGARRESRPFSSLRHAGGLLDGGVNGDGLADFRIAVGVTALAAGDFIL